MHSTRTTDSSWTNRNPQNEDSLKSFISLFVFTQLLYVFIIFGAGEVSSKLRRGLTADPAVPEAELSSKHFQPSGSGHLQGWPQPPLSSSVLQGQQSSLEDSSLNRIKICSHPCSRPCNNWSSCNSWLNLSLTPNIPKSNGSTVPGNQRCCNHRRGGEFY